jgi:hypothetical protein
MGVEHLQLAQERAPIIFWLILDGLSSDASPGRAAHAARRATN